MKREMLKIQTRGALVAYMLQNLRVEFEDPATPPEIQQISLKNRDKIKRWLFDLMTIKNKE
jgi:hypothetical protein